MLSRPRIDRTADRTDRGELPAPMGHTASVAPSDGNPCDGCDETVAPVEQIYFVNVRGALLRFHDTCYYAWATFKR